LDAPTLEQAIIIITASADPDKPCNYPPGRLRMAAIAHSDGAV
jgi:hypothetical protein